MKKIILAALLGFTAMSASAMSAKEESDISRFMALPLTCYAHLDTDGIKANDDLAKGYQDLFFKMKDDAAENLDGPQFDRLMDKIGQQSAVWIVNESRSELASLCNKANLDKLVGKVTI